MGVITIDEYGLDVSTSRDSLNYWILGLNESLSFDNSGIENLTKSVNLNSEFALGFACLARQQMIHGMKEHSRVSLHRAIELKPATTERESSQISVLQAVMEFNNNALQLALSHIAKWPIDVFVFSMIVGPFGLLAFSGKPNWRQLCVDLMLKHQHHWPKNNWWYLTTLAFSYAEIGALELAEPLAEHAWDLNKTGNCAHTLSHVHFELGSFNKGEHFINDWMATYGSESDMRHHLNWHSALIKFDQCSSSTEYLTELFSSELSPKKHDPMPLTTYSDNASLLWRSMLHNMTITDKFVNEIISYGEEHYEQTGFSFADLHSILCILLVENDISRSTKIEQYKQSSDHIISSCATGFEQFMQQDYKQSEKSLKSVIASNDLLGGSNPQRRIIEETYLEACIRSGNKKAAKSVLNKRLRSCKYDKRQLKLVK